MKNETTDKTAEEIIGLIKSELNKNAVTCEKAGEGGQSSVYKVTLDAEPFVIAVKAAKNYELMEKEREFTEFILSRADIPMPRTLFLKKGESETDLSYMGMEYLEGVNANGAALLYRMPKTKRRLRDTFIENLEKLQSVKGEKYGRYDAPEYDDWHDYYFPFAEKVMKFTEEEMKGGRMPAFVGGTMRKAFDNYENIFDEPVGAPTLTHGDLWLPNVLVNRKTLAVTGILDPFNVVWAEPDYELLAVIAGNGNKYKIYETYKKKHGISEKCDLKLEFYALFSEVYWYSITGHKYDDFLVYKAKLLNKQMKRFGI